MVVVTFSVYTKFKMFCCTRANCKLYNFKKPLVHARDYLIQRGKQLYEPTV